MSGIVNRAGWERATLLGRELRCRGAEGKAGRSVRRIVIWVTVFNELDQVEIMRGGQFQDIDPTEIPDISGDRNRRVEGGSIKFFQLETGGRELMFS